MTVRPVCPAFSGVKRIIARAGIGDITLELRGTSEADWIDLTLHFRPDSPIDAFLLAAAINGAQRSVEPRGMMAAAPAAPGTERAHLEAFLAGRALP